MGSEMCIRDSSKPRAFFLQKGGELRVTVGMKNFMHDEVFTGMPRPGVFAGEPHQLFIGSVPIVEDAPAFNLKPMKPETLRKIQERYDSVHCRLKSLYPEGESACVLSLCDSNALANEGGS